METPLRLLTDPLLPRKLMTTATKLNLDHMTQEVAAMVRDYISQTKLIQQKIDEYCEDEGLDMTSDDFTFEMEFPFTINENN